jgi:prepilin peptidase CpaA
MFEPSSFDARAAVALLIALTAVVHDVRTRRIPNYLTFGGAAAALLFGIIRGGLPGAVQPLGGWLLGAAMFFPFFALGGMGAGDVKLLAALGAWLGPFETLWLAIFASMAGGVIAAGVALSTGYLRQAAVNLWVMLVHWRTAGMTPVPGINLRESSAPRLAYAIPIAIGVLCTLWRR